MVRPVLDHGQGKATATGRQPFANVTQSSSFVGPLIVGIISDATGNIRYAFFFLVVMIWLAVPLLLSVDVEEGRRDTSKYKYQSIDDAFVSGAQYI